MQRSGRKCSRSRAVRVTESLSDSVTESRASGSSISSSDASTATATSADRGKVAKRASPLGWPIRKAMCSVPDSSKDEQPRPCLEESKFNRQGSRVSDIDLMVKRFAKLLLGEDMSGSGKGVCAALAISNAITNLCGTVFGQLWRLEPLSQEKKSMWQREMEWLLCVSDHIVEFIPSCQTFPDGTKLEVMTCRPRSDLFVNIPALRKLDNMLLDILDSFRTTDFWYIDQGIIAADSANGSAPLHKPIQRQADKWWLPVPRIPPGGLHDNSRKQLHHKRDCANQILKAALAINSAALADMEVPESYLETLPKNGKACLGDAIYRYITSDHFSSECMLDFLDLSSEHVALEIANRVEASIYVWRRRSSSKPIANLNRCTTKSSWEMVKDLMVDGDKRGFLAERAAGLLLCLKQQFPGLNQTTLDTCKIQCNKDVGKSILESYSRILESVAFNIVARIDDLVYVDDLTKHSLNKLPPVPRSVSVVAHEKVGSPYSALTTPRRRQNRSPGPPLVSPATGERTPFLSGDKPNHRGFGVRRALTSYLGGEIKTKSGCGNGLTEGGASSVSRTGVIETPRRSGACRTGKRSVHQQNLQKL